MSDFDDYDDSSRREKISLKVVRVLSCLENRWNNLNVRLLRLADFHVAMHTRHHYCPKIRKIEIKIKIGPYYPPRHTGMIPLCHSMCKCPYAMTYGCALCACRMP